MAFGEPAPPEFCAGCREICGRNVGIDSQLEPAVTTRPLARRRAASIETESRQAAAENLRNKFCARSAAKLLMLRSAVFSLKKPKGETVDATTFHYESLRRGYKSGAGSFDAGLSVVTRSFHMGWRLRFLP
jgi:hypothetical protein